MKQPKHHYVPEFYLKRWSQANPDQKLFSGKYVPATNTMEWTPRAPSGTGYERALYGEIEESFFKPLDNDACNILNNLESQDILTTVKLDLGEKNHARWAEFIIGLIVRRPDNVKLIQEGFADAGVDKSIAIDQIPKIINNKRSVKDLRSLTWMFAMVNTNLELITCDNPLLFKPNNLSHPDCVIKLPMGPMHFFLATRDHNICRLEKSARKMVMSINIDIIKNADERIYAKSKNSVAQNFVIKHWRSSNDC